MRSIFLVMVLSALAMAQKPSQVWVADNGNGTYKNPVLHADYSDPDVVRVGSDFYLTASSFNSSPGLPILHSKDLVNWKIIAHVYAAQPPLTVFNKVMNGGGAWAPSIRYHAGSFYIFYPDPDIGIYMVKAKDAAGPWSAPRLIKSAPGLKVPSSISATAITTSWPQRAASKADGSWCCVRATCMVLTKGA